MANCKDEHRYWGFFEQLPDDQGELEDTSVVVVLMKEDIRREQEEMKPFILT